MTPAGPAPLRPADLVGLGGITLLEAARDYVLLGHVHAPRRRGARIAADVDGTDATYGATVDVWAEGEGAPLLRPHCDCPSRRPYCKHVLALLHLWASAPEAFACLDDVEEALARSEPAELAALLVGAAMTGGPALEAAVAAAAPVDWAGVPPGRCLQEWKRFCADGRAGGRWPEAALALGLRIAGPPGGPPARRGAEAALTLRQLCWWLIHMAQELPAAAVRPWLGHLATHLEAAREGPDSPLRPELGVWLARLAAGLPEALAAERRWLARFAAAHPLLHPVFEAQAQILLWTEELSARIAVAPAIPQAVGRRCREVLALLDESGAGEGQARRGPD